MPKKWTDEDLEILKQHYKPGRQTAVELSSTLLSKFSQREISAKAYRMALSQKRWSDDEEELLEAIAETMPFPELAKYWRRQATKRGFPVRSEDALKIKLNRLGYSQKPIVAGWNAKVLARGLGVAPKVVFAWIKDGKLKTKWLGERGGEYLITPRQLRNFCAEYPAEFSTLRMDGDGFAWLLQAILQ